MNNAKMNKANVNKTKYTGKRWNKVNTSATNEGANIASRNEAIENRRASVPEITNSRQDTGENHPKEALLIMGHGNEGFKPRIPIEHTDTPEIIAEKSKDLIPDLIPVPKGSIVVIKSHSGDVTFNNDVLRNYMSTLKKDNENAILDPIANIDKITKIQVLLLLVIKLVQLIRDLLQLELGIKQVVLDKQLVQLQLGFKQHLLVKVQIQLQLVTNLE